MTNAFFDFLCLLEESIEQLYPAILVICCKFYKQTCEIHTNKWQPFPWLLASFFIKFPCNTNVTAFYLKLICFKEYNVQWIKVDIAFLKNNITLSVICIIRCIVLQIFSYYPILHKYGWQETIHYSIFRFFHMRQQGVALMLSLIFSYLITNCICKFEAIKLHRFLDLQRNDAKLSPCADNKRMAHSCIFWRQLK